MDHPDYPIADTPRPHDLELAGSEPLQYYIITQYNLFFYGNIS